ncbi:hypothetical protein DSECCO2_427630 [anaerobic digester metagenome]
MYKLFRTCLAIFWVLDILDFPFMEIFDTIYPVNGLAWFLIWVFIPSIHQYTKDED